MGWDFNTAFKKYGSEWRAERRMFQQAYKPDAVLAYHPIQTQNIHNLLHNLLATPEDFREHYRLSVIWFFFWVAHFIGSLVYSLAGAIITSTVYGHDISGKSDYYVDMVATSAKRLAEGLVPGKYAVNALPFLSNLPEWFPGCQFHLFARETRQLNKEILERPLKIVENDIVCCVYAVLLIWPISSSF